MSSDKVCSECGQQVCYRICPMQDRYAGNQDLEEQDFQAGYNGDPFGYAQEARREAAMWEDAYSNAPAEDENDQNVFGCFAGFLERQDDVKWEDDDILF